MALETKGTLTTEEVALKIAQLCAWQVGVVILSRYQIAILPNGLENIPTVQDGIDLMRASKLCSTLFDAIWSVGKDYKSIENDACSLLRTLISNPRNKIESIAAIIGYWYFKAKLRTDSKIYPPLKRLLLLIAGAASSIEDLTKDQSRRFWIIYLSIVEIEHGVRMDTQKEREAIELAAEVAAEIDLKQSFSGEHSICYLLNLGMTEGTSNHDVFNNAYTSSHVIQSKKRK